MNESAQPSALERRLHFDELMERIYQIDYESMSKEELIKAGSRTVELHKEPADFLRKSNASDSIMMVHLLHSIAETTLLLHSMLGREAGLLSRAKTYIEKAASQISRENEPLLAVKNDVLNGIAMHFGGRIDDAEVILSKSREIIKDHVANYRAILREGDEATVFAMRELDKHIRAEELLCNCEDTLAHIQQVVRPAMNATESALTQMLDQKTQPDAFDTANLPATHSTPNSNKRPSRLRGTAIYLGVACALAVLTFVVSWAPLRLIFGLFALGAMWNALKNLVFGRV